MKLKVVITLVMISLCYQVCLAEEKKDTSLDLRKIAAEPKAPELPDEVDIIKEVLKTKVIEQEIEPLDELEETQEMEEKIEYAPSVFINYLDEFSAAFNTKNLDALKTYINLNDFFILDWQQNLIKSEEELSQVWESLMNMGDFNNWRSSLKLQLIKEISDNVYTIASDIKIFEGENDVMEGTILMVVEVKDDAVSMRGLHISKKYNHEEIQQAIGKNQNIYISLILGLIIGFIISRIFIKKRDFTK